VERYVAKLIFPTTFNVEPHRTLIEIRRVVPQMKYADDRTLPPHYAFTLCLLSNERTLSEDFLLRHRNVSVDYKIFCSSCKLEFYLL
jgi:hypothetical protein